MSDFRPCYLVYALLAAAWLTGGTASAAPPKTLLQQGPPRNESAAGNARIGYAIMRMPDGSFAFYDRHQPASGPLKLADRSGQIHTLLPYLPQQIVQSESILASSVLANTQVVLTPDDQVNSVFVKAERLDKETAAKVGLPLYLDVWIKQASLTKAAEPRMIWRGYNGSQMEYQQLPSGRLLVPYGSFQPHATPVPPTGRHKTIIQFSDDGGHTWQESPTRLVSPCYPNFNGLNEGACEPAIEQLTDGRLWMLMRTQAGFLYESFSHDEGTTWHPARASRFNTSTGPPNIMRHQNGWLVVCWNNCEMPPRHAGQGVYGGRDALQIAVSDDEGQTWRGFREIYLDHRRHDNPARAGDRGTAYPLGAYTSDGQLVILAGQGTGGRNPILVDPQWIIETAASTDFSQGLDGWSVYKHHGPATRWWRARAVGCQLVANPVDPQATSLHIRKPDERAADGAVWNFPNGWKGSLTARVMTRPGFEGGTICLNDRMFDPTNDAGEELAVFRCDLGRQGELGSSRLEPGRWYDICLNWDLAESLCQLLVDGVPSGELELLNPTLNGVSYVRFRSTAEETDPAGFLLDRVQVVIADPYAPACQPRDQAAHERRYVNKVVPSWVD